MASTYVQTRFTSESGWTLTPGVRVDHHSLSGRTAASPWAQAMVPLSRGLTIRGGGGMYRQEPGFAEQRGVRGSPGLLPERAYHADVGIEGRFAAAGRWQITVYDREDRDELRLPEIELRVVNVASLGTVLMNPSLSSRWSQGKGRPMIRLVAIDIDGTLLDSRGHLPDVHRDAVAAAHARGRSIALVTGRSFHFAQPIAKLLPLPLTLVCNNGAIVKNEAGETALRHLLPRDTARRVLADTRRYEDSVAVIFDRPDERQIVFERMDWSHPNRSGYYAKNKAFITKAAVPLAEMLSEDPLQVMFNGSVAPMRELVAALRALPIADRCSVALTEYERRDFSLVDVNGAGCSKGATLARWVESCGLARHEVMAVGDNFNDIEMLEFAGTAVVMGNATDALKQRGFPVTGTNDEGGLAMAIEQYVLEHARRRR